MKIVHVITGLNTGGAEIMLWRLLTAFNRRDDIQNVVICMSKPGPVANRILELKVPIHSLNMQPGKINPADILHLAQLLKREKADIIQTWMVHADLIGGISARLAGSPPVVWGIHNPSLDPALTKKSTLRVIKLCAALSGWLPANIISCSRNARDIHIEAGYKASKFEFIPNGFDLLAFQPDPLAHSKLNQSLGIPLDTRNIGLIARFHPQKDVENFIRAAAIINKNFPKVHFILCGDEMTPQNPELASWVSAGALQGNIHLLGRMDNTPEIMAGLDIFALSSLSEAFPLVLGEAMSCGIPCVSTNVGDSAYLIGDTGLIVPPHDSPALAGAIASLLTLPEAQLHELGKNARQRIQDNFSLELMAQSYFNLYKSLS